MNFPSIIFLAPKRFLPSLKEVTGMAQLSSVVYKISCINCDKSNIGPTRQYLEDRIEQQCFQWKICFRFWGCGGSWFGEL